MGFKKIIQTMKSSTTLNQDINRKKRIFTAEHKRKLSISHKGQVSWRKGKKFVDEKVSREKRKLYRKEWRLKNKDRLLEQDRAWKQANRQRIALLARLRYQKNAQKELDRIRLKKYGITGDEFRKILKYQNFKCPVCNRKITKNLSVDHNHLTGRIRGLICNNCNLAIGNADESSERLRALARYLNERS